ncbi:MAG TPA: DsrE/DsrF/DrsH-like family protein [Anaerolineae bacterium]|nr:DsrE/DsrF/DrsH-like family protein [Anaerolineae bacterium]
MLSPEIQQQVEELVAKRIAEMEAKKEHEAQSRRKRLALVASKGSLDMAYPPLILASTAVSLGWEVGVFFTFYGLDIVNKNKLPALKVAPIGNPAMPAPLSAVPIQVPNFVGMLPGMTPIATAMMKTWFDRANIPPLQELIDVTREGGGHLYACTTTMGVMGVHEENLIEGVECRGAAAFLEFAAGADVALFI